jgi:hypothetical protein
MEPEASILHSQVPATCPYLESDQSNPYLHITLPVAPSSYYPAIYAWVSQVVCVPTKTQYTPLLSYIRAAYPAHRILLDFFTRTMQTRYLLTCLLHGTESFLKS